MSLHPPHSTRPVFPSAALDLGEVLGAAVNNSYNGSTLPAVSGNPDLIILQQAVDGNASVLQAHGDVATAGTEFSSLGSGGTRASRVAECALAIRMVGNIFRTANSKLCPAVSRSMFLARAPETTREGACATPITKEYP